jgi:NADH:ubiquinone oxidoreductase subunit 5 (subunit L)/multisubunit Na+/H+ antiporter MnhA subunit
MAFSADGRRKRRSRRSRSSSAAPLLPWRCFWPRASRRRIRSLLFHLAHWIRSGSFQVDFSFYLDQLSLVMLLVVTGVGFLIHIYSVGYMWEDDGYYRFMAYLNLFMFFMLTLVLAKNYLVMFIGWEGVGLASYLLIGFWFTKTRRPRPARRHSSSTALATLDS